MKNLLPGLRKYSDSIYPQQIELFNNLANGQSPHTMLITCSDSRIDPNLITQTGPGELFVLRNAGNIVPPFGASKGGEESAIEFAIKGLNVKNIVICGHSKCGAMAALSGSVDMSPLPSTESWLDHAAATKSRMNESGVSDLSKYIEENVLVQIQNLKTHPAVSAALMAKKIKLFAWVYHFELGEMCVYDTQLQKFIPSCEIDDEDDKILKHFEL